MEPKWSLVALTLLTTLAHSSPALAVLGACGDRPLPEDRIRKLDVSSIRLSCSTGSDSFVRGPKAWDYEAWEVVDNQAANAASNGDKTTELEARREMQKIAQSPETSVRWSGSLPYQTMESWNWVDWVFGEDRVACGVDIEHKEHCDTTPAHEECSSSTSCSTDSQGNQDCHPVSDCHTIPSETHCWTETIEHVRSCWHDEPRHEERPCSSEVVNYRAEFVRPSQSEWGPGVNGYYDILPNKYDLLPGEIETIQVAGNGTGTSVEFGDPWNKYTPDVRYTNGAPSCTPHVTHEVDIKIYTNERLIKNSPNAFRLPVDPQTKEPMDPLRWTEDAKNVKLKPNQLRLMDSSSEVVRAMARQSRNFDAQIIQAKADSAQISNIKPGESTEILKKQMSTSGFKGFWKDTQIRIRLLESRPAIYRNVKVSDRIVVSGADVEIDSSLYMVPLDGSSADRDLYRSRGPFTKRWSVLTYELRPSANYKMMISMYQKGVPFYTKEGNGSSEESYFSKELPVEFKTDPNNDIRGPLQILADFQRAPFWQIPSELWHIIRRVSR